MGRPRPAINILLVDDQPELLLLYAFGLEHYGFNVVKAQSAEEALLKISTYSIDVVLSDIQMPRKDGFWLLKSARPIYPSVLFCFMSSAANLYRGRGIACGALAVLDKPLNFKEFCAFCSCFLRFP